VAPLVVLVTLTVFLVMFVIQISLVFHAKTVLNAAAQDAVRAAQLENAAINDGQAAAAEILAGSSGLLSNVDVDSDPTATAVTFTVSADVLSVVPFWSGSVSGSASGPREMFRPEAER
jgi:Flp pilus assembly protein TadG